MSDQANSSTADAAAMLRPAIDQFKAGDYRAATALLAPRIAESPHDGDAQFLMGISRFRLGDFAGAYPCFEVASEQQPRNAMAHYYRGLCAEQCLTPDIARAHFQEALSVDTTLESARRRLASLAGPAPRPRPAAGGVSSDDPISADFKSADPERVRGALVLKAHRRLRSFQIPMTAILLTPIVAGLILLIGAIAGQTWSGASLAAAIVSLHALTLPPLVLAAAGSAVTHYSFYERRIDICTGILFRKKVSIWLFQIEDVWLTRSPVNLITGDAVLHLRASGLSGTGPDIRVPGGGRHRVPTGRFRITGVGNARKMDALFEMIRDNALGQRRAIKNWWV